MAIKEGYKDKISFCGLVVSILLLIAFLWVVPRNLFELNTFSRFSSELVEVTSNMGQSTSRYLWTNRTLDLIVQAALVFGAAAGCIAMLRPGKEEH